MAKPILYRLFGLGKIPESLRSELDAEGIVLLDEGIKGSVTYRNFRAPRVRSNWRRQLLVASIVLTKVRLLALGNSKPTVNVPLADDRIREMRYSLEENGAVFCIAFEAGLFHGDWSGTIEYRFHTREATRFWDLLPKKSSAVR